MTARTNRFAAIAALVAALVLGGYWYWSPFLALRQMQTAAQQKDAGAFNEHVDYPRLRESLKGQLSGLLGKEIAKIDRTNPFAAFGSLLGLTMVDKMVDALVRPETVMRAMQEGELYPESAKKPDEAPSQPPGSAGVPPEQRVSEKPQWTFERKGVDRLIAYASDPKKPEAKSEEKLGVVFERSGFATWKLTEVRLPPV